MNGSVLLSQRRRSGAPRPCEYQEGVTVTIWTVGIRDSETGQEGFQLLRQECPVRLDGKLRVEFLAWGGLSGHVTREELPHHTLGLSPVEALSLFRSAAAHRRQLGRELIEKADRWEGWAATLGEAEAAAAARGTARERREKPQPEPEPDAAEIDWTVMPPGGSSGGGHYHGKG